MKKKNSTLITLMVGTLLLGCREDVPQSQEKAESREEPGKIGQVSIGGMGVSKSGDFEFTKETSLRDLLNQAECHKCTFLSRIRVTRKIDGRFYVLRLFNKPPGGKLSAEKFEMVDGDLINVPCRMFNASDHEIPRTVTDDFYVVSKTEQSP